MNIVMLPASEAAYPSPQSRLTRPPPDAQRVERSRDREAADDEGEADQRDDRERVATVGRQFILVELVRGVVLNLGGFLRCVELGDLFLLRFGQLDTRLGERTGDSGHAWEVRCVGLLVETDEPGGDRHQHEDSDRQRVPDSDRDRHRLPLVPAED